MAITSLLTATGRYMVTGRLKGATPTQGETLDMGMDTNPNNLTVLVSDVGPYALPTEAMVAGTSSVTTTTTTDDTYSVAATFNITASSESIGGVYLSDSATKAPTTTVVSGSAVGSSSGTTLVVSSASGFPNSGNYYFQARTECLEVTGGQGTTSWTVVRGANGSTAISTIAASDPIVGGNIPGSGGVVTGGNMAVHTTWPGLALVSGDSLAVTQTLKFT